jgi:hypothetical protein
VQIRIQLHFLPVSGIRIGFNADPDPAFLVNVDPDPDPGDFMTKNWKKCTAEFFSSFFGQKASVKYVLHEKSSKNNIQHFRNFFTFAGNSLIIW